MGILDDAIRDHLDLKRRRGTDEPELKKLEDEAFGPPGRPDASGVAPTASAVAEPKVETESAEITPEDLGLESLPSRETPPPDGPAPEEPPAPAPEPGASTESSGESGEVVFHDFAAEEGLVGGRGAPETIEPADPVERALAQPAAEAPPEAPSDEASPAEPTEAKPAVEEEPAAEAPPADAPAPHAEDTQVHDMEKELEVVPDEPAPPATDSGDAGEKGDGETVLELEVEELEIEIDEDELVLDEPEDPGDDDSDVGEEGDDVLEETPEFLRDAPESDRLWFEQGKPKDFDFDED